jgi:hypothetical protein
MPRNRHPKKEVEEALVYAENFGWRVEVGGSHAWGRIYCPVQRPGLSVWRILYFKYLEYASKRNKSCETDSQGGR